MSSFLDKKTGIYDPSKRYGFKNITDKPFTFSWGNQPITVKAGEEIEVPEHYALLATKKIVDQIMMEEVATEEAKMRAELKDPYWRSPKGISIGIPAARKVYEDKVLRELTLNEESPQVQVMRAQIREQILSDIDNSQKPKVPVESVVANFAQSGKATAPAEFADITSSSK